MAMRHHPNYYHNKRLNEKTYRGTLYVRGLNKDVLRHFKAACCRRGRTMTEIIDQLIRNYVREETGEYFKGISQRRIDYEDDK